MTNQRKMYYIYHADWSEITQVSSTIADTWRNKGRVRETAATMTTRRKERSCWACATKRYQTKRRRRACLHGVYHVTPSLSPARPAYVASLDDVSSRGRSVFYLYRVQLLHAVSSSPSSGYLILDRLLTFLVAFSTVVLKPSFSQSLSLYSHLSLVRAISWNLTTRVFGSHWRW